MGQVQLNGCRVRAWGIPVVCCGMSIPPPAARGRRRHPPCMHPSSLPWPLQRRNGMRQMKLAKWPITPQLAPARWLPHSWLPQMPGPKGPPAPPRPSILLLLASNQAPPSPSSTRSPHAVLCALHSRTLQGPQHRLPARWRPRACGTPQHSPPCMREPPATGVQRRAGLQQPKLSDCDRNRAGAPAGPQRPRHRPAHLQPAGAAPLRHERCVRSYSRGYRRRRAPAADVRRGPARTARGAQAWMNMHANLRLHCQCLPVEEKRQAPQLAHAC